jgi:hypothetical protein
MTDASLLRLARAQFIGIAISCARPGSDLHRQPLAHTALGRRGSGDRARDRAADRPATSTARFTDAASSGWR